MSAQIERQVVTLVGAGTSTIIKTIPQAWMLCGVTVEKKAGVIAAGKVQTTMDLLDAASVASAVWVDHPYLVNLTDTAAGNVSAPITGMRFINAGVGTVDLVCLQYIGS